MTAEGKPAISHARGGAHGTIEKPYGPTLTSLAKGEEGKTLWSADIDGYDPPFACHWNSRYVLGFSKGQHLVMDALSGSVLRTQPLYTGARLWKYDQAKSDWAVQDYVAIKAGKNHPNTNQANLAIGDWHWFLSHNLPYLCRVNVESGAVEYLELPAQLMASEVDRADDVWLWGKGNPTNKPLNASGFAIGDKGNIGIGWGHISAASPTRVGRYLFLPVVTGTVYVIDTEVAALSPESLVAVNDLGISGETWTLASLTFAKGRLFAHTMKEIVCIENKQP
jgi:hypothetical protein